MRYASPYTPGAGAMPRYLAGRESMLEEADKILEAVAMGYPQKPVIYLWTARGRKNSFIECY